MDTAKKDKLLKELDDQNIAKAEILCCVLGLIAGKSRGAWLTLTIVLPLVSFRYIFKSKKNLTIALAIVLIIVGSIASSQEYRQRAMSISNITTDISNADRIRVWESAFYMIKDNPIAGVGLGEFRKVYNSGYRTKETVQDMVHSHNNIIQIWAETGTIGIFGFLYMSLYV